MAHGAARRAAPGPSFEGPGGKIKMAVKTESKMLGQVQLLSIDSVDFGPVDPKVFELPDSIKALVGARDAKAASGKTEEKPGDTPADAPKDQPKKSDPPKDQPPKDQPKHSAA